MDKTELIRVTQRNVSNAQKQLYEIALQDYEKRKSYVNVVSQIYSDYYELYCTFFERYIKDSRYSETYIHHIRGRLERISNNKQTSDALYVDEYIGAALHLIGFIECFVTTERLMEGPSSLKILDDE